MVALLGLIHAAVDQMVTYKTVRTRIWSFLPGRKGFKPSSCSMFYPQILNWRGKYPSRQRGRRTPSPPQEVIPGGITPKPLKPLYPKPRKPLNPKSLKPLNPKPPKYLNPMPLKPINPRPLKLLNPKPLNPPQNPQRKRKTRIRKGNTRLVKQAGEPPTWLIVQGCVLRVKC